MARPSARRPLPALAFLLALSLLTALVWWRVIHRSDSAPATKVTPTATCAAPNPNVVPQPSSVTVQVMNSTDRNGLAATTGNALRAVSFKISGVDNVTPLIPDFAVIKYAAANLAAAKLVSTYFPSSTMLLGTPKAGQVEVDLGAKFTTTLTAADAAKALAAAKLTLAPATSAATPTC